MARGGSAARRYAEAAFQLADRDNASDRWADDLTMAAEVVSDPALARLIDSPMVPLRDREAVLEGALKTRLSPQALNLVRLLLRRSKLNLLPNIAREYQRLLNQKRGVVSAVITSALPLTPDEDKAVRSRIAEMTGTKVEVASRIDPSLIGGLTVRIGDRLIDASVRGRLERLREQLLAGTRTGG